VLGTPAAAAVADTNRPRTVGALRSPRVRLGATAAGRCSSDHGSSYLPIEKPEDAEGRRGSMAVRAR
jgi:hypothetical protein